jgi:L-threonylcarbamoyladenylate synthase
MIGLTPAQVHAISADTLRRQLCAPLTDQTWFDHTGQPFTVHMGLRPFKPVRALIAWLDQHGITPWIVSASNPWTVAAVAPLVGIPPARVIGLTTAVRDGLLTAELDGPITYRQGKVDALDQRGLPRPALSVGDAWTDWELLCAAQHAAILLDKGDAALREAAHKQGVLVQDRSLLEPDHLAHLDPVPRPAIYAVGADLSPALIAQAAHAIWDANLVAMPTETVYGLAADASNPAAIARIYAAKGRPTTNPLILHAPDTASARKLAASWPDAAQRLADAFWPGPLTLVLPRAAHVSTLATAGADTVALRVPAHPVARALLEACGTPLAAPSANRSNHISPTTAAHVAASLGPHVDLILDAGPCDVGLESTIVSLVGPPTVLRPGMITLDQLRQHIPDIQHKAPLPQPDDATPHAAPGQSLLHYAPVTPAALLPPDHTPSGHHVGLLTYGPKPGLTSAPHGYTLTLPDDPAGYARGLYDALHTLDSMSLTRILIHAPPEDEPWAAARDRLTRASRVHT